MSDKFTPEFSTHDKAGESKRSKELIKKARELDAKATKPWLEIWTDDIEGGSYIRYSHESGIQDPTDEDKEFILESRTLLPALAAALESSMKREEKLKILVKYYGKYAIRYCREHHWLDTGYVCGNFCKIKFEEALKEPPNA